MVQQSTLAAFASTLLISVAPNVFLVLFPQYASGEGANSAVLSLGQAIAAGGLLGDVFLHVIPHASGSHDVGVWILLGFSIFMVCDMLIRQLGHTHSHGSHDKSNKKEDHDHTAEHKKSLVLLNLAADALHNFTDGIAIGASYSHYATKATTTDDTFLQLMQSRGGLATLSILFHEIPHELGDFAILVKQGFSKQQAIMAQFGTAIAAMIGTWVGLVAAHIAGDELIFVTAGGFVYLAAVNILPEILDEERSARFRLLQVLFFAIGIGFLYAVSLLEEMDEHGGHSHGHHHHHQESHDHVANGHSHHHHAHHDHEDVHLHHSHHDHGHGHAESHGEL